MSNNLYKTSTLYNASGNVKNSIIELDNVKNLLSKIHSYDEKNLNNLLEKKEIEPLNLNLKETSILINALNYYLKKEENDKIIANMTMINHLTKNNLKKIDNKEKALFKRAEKTSFKERMIFLKEDLRKMSLYKLSKATLKIDPAIELLKNDITLDRVNEILSNSESYTEEYSYFNILKFRLKMANSTRIGKLYLHEKIYAYTTIIFNHLIRRK